MTEVKQKNDVRKILLVVFGVMLAIVTIAALIVTIIDAKNGRISREDYMAHYFYIGIIIFFSIPPIVCYIIERQNKNSLMGPMADQARSPALFITGLIITVVALLLHLILQIMIFPCEGLCIRGLAKNFYLIPIIIIGIAFTVLGAMRLFSKKYNKNENISLVFWIIYFVVLFVEDITFLLPVV